MSDTDKPQSESYSLSFGGGKRSITDRSEEAEAWPGTRRSIYFDDCKLTIRSRGRQTIRTAIGVNVSERSPDRRPWPYEPWKIGELDNAHTFLSLDVSSLVFQHFWDTVDVPENERFFVGISGQTNPNGALSVDTITLDRVWPRTHPVVLELRQQRQQTNAEWTRAIVTAMAWFVAVVVAIELIRWLWR